MQAASTTESAAKLNRGFVDKEQVFLTGPQVQRRYQKSHVSIWRWIQDDSLGFPAPLKIHRLNYWRLAELEAWEAARQAKG